MDIAQVLSFQHAVAQLQGIQTDLLNGELPEPGQDGEISDCVLSHLNHAVCPALFLNMKAIDHTCQRTFLSFNEQAFEGGYSFSERVEDMAFRIVELYAQRNSIWGHMKKDGETVVGVKAPTRVEEVDESARVPDARGDHTGMIAPFEATTLERTGPGSVAPFKTGSSDNVPDKAHLQDAGKKKRKGEERDIISDEERVVEMTKPKTIKVGPSVYTPKTKRVGPKRQETDKVCSLPSLEMMLTVSRTTIPVVKLVG